MPQIKNPSAPATDAQINAIVKMAKKLGQDVPAFAGMTKGQASEMIGQLGEQLDAQNEAAGMILADQKTAQAKPSLLEMAAKLEGKSAPVHPAVEALQSDHTLAAEGKLSITVDQAKTLLSWYPVLAAEVDPTIDDQAMEATLQAFVNPPMNDPQVQQAVGEALSGIPAGHYAIGPEGETKFYRVQYGKPGTKWDGFCFVDVQASETYYPIKGKGRFEVLEAISAQGVHASAARYGHELGKCFKCLKTLTDPESLAKGMGPDCEKSLGL